MTKDLIVRSSSAEFLIFERQTHDKGIQVRFEDGDLWLTQKAIGELFNVDRTVVTKHIKNIYSEFELNENSTSANYALVQKEGNREITRKVLYYNLDMVISVGYRTNSDRAIQFRRWATYILKEFSKKGYIIDKKRMENGVFFDEDYYDSLLAEIREIRLFNLSDSYIVRKENQSEFFAIREGILNCGRIVGYLMLLFAGISGSQVILNIVMVILTLSILIMGMNIRKIEKFEEKI